MGRGGAFGLLMLEFWLYASHDATVRTALAGRVRLLRSGLFLQHLIDEDAIPPSLRADAVADIIDPTPHG